MCETLQRSLSRTAVSIAAVALAFMAGSGTCAAGDKIEFTIPGNPTLAQKPEIESKAEDAQAPLKFDTGMQGPNMGDIGQPTTTTVIVPADRTKRNGLRAWDSGMKPFGLGDQDDLLAPEAKPQASRALTNDFDAKSEWDAQSTLSKPGNRAENFSGFSAQRPQTAAGSAYRGGNNLWGGPGMEDAGSRTTSENDKPSDTGGLSAWGKTFTSAKESYSERVDEYRSMYNPPALSVGGADALVKLGASPTPGVGDGSIPGSAADDAWGARTGAPNAFDSFNSEGGSLGASRYNGAQSGTSIQSQPSQNQTPPPMVNPFGNGNPMAAQPAILPFPRKPGSVFQ